MESQSCSIEYFSPNQAKTPSSHVGFLLVLGDDLISRLVVSITKQEFSSIGFYYLSTLTNSYQVYLTDPLGNHIYGKDIDLKVLCSNPLIRRLVKRPLLCPIDRKSRVEDKFRLAISKFRSHPADPLHLLHQLFGYPSSSRGITALDRADQMMEILGQRLPQVNCNTLYGSGFESFLDPPSGHRGIDSRIQIFAYLASYLNQTTPLGQSSDGSRPPAQIQSYITDDTFLGTPENLSLTKKDSRTSALQTSYDSQIDIVQKLTAEFTQLLKDPGFSHIVSKEMKNQTLKLIHQSFLRSLKKKRLMIEALSQIVPQNVMASYLADFNIEQVEAGLLLGENLEPVPVPEQENPVSKLRELVSTAINESESIDLRQLVNISNQLSLSMSQPQIQIPSQLRRKGSFYLSPEQVQLKLKSGSSINLPCHGADLSNFDYEVLVEILEALEKMSEVSVYDSLRTQIAQEIASFPSYCD